MDLFVELARLSKERELPLLVIGGHAVNAYGYNRTTLDVDFVIAIESFSKWRPALESLGYRWIGQTETFARLQPPKTNPPSFPIDVMFVSPETFAKLDAEKVELDFGEARLPVPQPLHLIALKLHAMKNPERLKKGKDLPDIVNLVSVCELDPEGPEFIAILDRYATHETRALILGLLR
jgi:predicted nucleotidyltransferase